MNCEYCCVEKYHKHPWNGTKTVTLDIGDYTYLYMVYDCKDKKFGIKAEGEGRAEIKINYCPMCGRKFSI